MGLGFRIQGPFEGRGLQNLVIISFDLLVKGVGCGRRPRPDGFLRFRGLALIWLQGSRVKGFLGGLGIFRVLGF